MSAYLRNAWYVAAWADEIQQKPFPRRILDEPVVFYRRSDGKVTALVDRCPHRFVPLSRGSVEGDVIKCGYHGLCFDSAGTCVDTRFNEQIRERSKLQTYPIEERYGAVWIWMGDEPADVSTIPPFEFLGDPARHHMYDHAVLNANYTLEIDNLLDLSHLDYLHLNSINSGHFTDGEFTVTQQGEVVHANWFTRDCPIPPQFTPHIKGAERVDHWAEVEWYPPTYVHIYSGATRCGEGKEAGYAIDHAHFLTPESATSTHYFWTVARPDTPPPEMREMGRKRLRQAFAVEDGQMLEAQQAAMKSNDFWAERPVIFPEDAGAIRARRVLESRIRDEQAKRAAASPARALAEVD